MKAQVAAWVGATTLAVVLVLCGVTVMNENAQPLVVDPPLSEPIPTPLPMNKPTLAGRWVGQPAQFTVSAPGEEKAYGYRLLYNNSQTAMPSFNSFTLVFPGDAERLAFAAHFDRLHSVDLYCVVSGYWGTIGKNHNILFVDHYAFEVHKRIGDAPPIGAAPPK